MIQAPTFSIGRCAGPGWTIAALAAMATGTGIASAQSTLSVYGALDAYVGVQSATGSDSRRVQNSSFNPNALGIAGAEDLGGGLRAGFVLEGQPALDTGSMAQGGKMWGRQSQVYLAGAFGQVSLGRLHGAGRSFGIKYSATGWLTTDPLGALTIAAGSAMAPAMNADTVGSRTSNSVQYSSPRWGAFSFSALQSTAEGGSFASGAAQLTQVGASHVSGNFSADVVGTRIPARAGSQIAQTDIAVGAQYTFPAVRVMASWYRRQGAAITEAGATTEIAGSRGTDHVLLAGLSLPLGAHTLGAAVGKLDVSSAHRGRRAANMSAPFSSVVDDALAWSLAWSCALSRRTQVFVAWGTLDNAAQGNASLTVDLRPVAGGRSSLLASGVRHSF